MKQLQRHNVVHGEIATTKKTLVIPLKIVSFLLLFSSRKAVRPVSTTEHTKSKFTNSFC